MFEDSHLGFRKVWNSRKGRWFRGPAAGLLIMVAGAGLIPVYEPVGQFVTVVGLTVFFIGFIALAIVLLVTKNGE